MKYKKNIYPFGVIYEDKISQHTGKKYSSVSISFTVIKNKDATDRKEKYETKFFNFFEPADLLKLATLCTTAYTDIVEERAREKAESRQTIQQQQTSQQSYDDLDDNILF